MHPQDQDICPNCDSQLYGQFCYACGQNQKGVDRFLLSILNEALENLFSKNSRVFLTLLYLLIRPGFLTREYFIGRRARYIQPIKLYIFTSLVFFSLLSLSNYLSDEVHLAPQVDVEGNANLVIITDDEREKITSTDSKNTKSREKISESIDKINIDAFDEETNHTLQNRLKQKLTGFLEPDGAGYKGFIADFIESAPIGLIVLVPFFALLLKIFYFQTGLYYTQHLVFTVYNHSFLFLALTLNLIIGMADAAYPALTGVLSTLLEIGIVIYIFLSTKVVYRQSTLLTFTKFLVLGFCYLMMFFLIYLIIFIWNIFA
ncbi:MAG: DUF3667 domain-containing protein [Gammaproteobacteria bacterium]|nr:DUF3667 domain-containing protein [Gammaproteobacteria bacterium]